MTAEAVAVAARPRRVVVHADALVWLGENRPPPGSGVVTSLPDVSEVPSLDLDGYRAWFVETAQRIIRWLPDDGVVIFFQSDIRRAGVIVDKGYLVLRAAEEARASVLFHKIVCRKPPGTVTLGRPSFSHMIALTRGEPRVGFHSGPDVLPDAGLMPWSRAMGVIACRSACRFLRDDCGVRLVVDPFCGHGTVLAVANAMGIDALGVELSAKRCRKARTLSFEEG